MKSLLPIGIPLFIATCAFGWWVENYNWWILASILLGALLLDEHGRRRP